MGTASPVTGPAISQSARGGRGCAVAFFSLFFFAGLGVAFPVLILPVYRVISTRNWKPTPCTILSSGVHTSRGEHNNTYSPQIRYRYRVGNQTYESEHDWPMSGHYGNNDPVDLAHRYRPRQQATCYVNPANPADAILSRDLPVKSM